MYFSLKKENTQMAENSRKNEFFERESIAFYGNISQVLVLCQFLCENAVTR